MLLPEPNDLAATCRPTISRNPMQYGSRNAAAGSIPYGLSILTMKSATLSTARVRFDLKMPPNIQVLNGFELSVGGDMS
jgi:hypothetical protein